MSHGGGLACSRLWCFTKQVQLESEAIAWPLANEDNLPLELPHDDGVQGLFYQVERAPSTGKIHLQGFIVFKKRCRFSTVQRLFHGCHLEAARGSQQQNIDYCSKSDTKVCGPFTVGSLEAPGRNERLRDEKRKPVDEAIDLVLEGKSSKEVAREYPKQFLFHSKGFQALERALLPSPPAWRTVSVTWIWGKTGVGKTRRCYASAPGLFKVNEDGQWWDGYLCQDTILFDEFYGEVKMKNMLNYLDGYPLQLPVKGGFVEAHWTKVYITSNVDPKGSDKVNPQGGYEFNFYSKVPQEVRDAFFRRITEIIHLDNNGDVLQDEDVAPVFFGARARGFQPYAPASPPS